MGSYILQDRVPAVNIHILVMTPTVHILPFGIPAVNILLKIILCGAFLLVHQVCGLYYIIIIIQLIMHFIEVSTMSCINPTAEDPYVLVLGPYSHSGASELGWNVCGVRE